MMVDANKAIAEFLDELNQPYLRRTHAGHINPIAYAGNCRRIRSDGV